MPDEFADNLTGPSASCEASASRAEPAAPDSSVQQSAGQSPAGQDQAGQGPAGQAQAEQDQAGHDPPDEKPSGRNQPMNFFAHLAELRRRLIYCLTCVAALTAVAWNFSAEILDVILSPVVKHLPPDQGLIYTGLPDAFAVTLKVSLWAGLMASAPFCLLQLWAFVAPGLLPSEKAKVPALTALATVLFASGALFAYLVAFPLTFKFFLAFSSDALQPLLTVDRYMSLVMGLAAAFALSFQLPLALMFLARIGLITPHFLKKNRPYAIVAIFVVAAILTPPDVISQVLMAVSLMFLYELSIFLVSRRRRPELDDAGQPVAAPDPAVKT
ncbi:MAG: twin-arginine translocase subunit TatC [Deltaproteobacteria bacterium]|nr:twin-arginine translocase subunit TatC [Deltaproteobacteria bacterium]